MKSKTVIINLAGGPCVGKSTVAAGVFFELKKRGISCELVREVAKDTVWEDTTSLLENQIHIFSEQFRRQWMVIDKVQFVITDSPLILNSVYLDEFVEKQGRYTTFDPEYLEQMRNFFDETFMQFNNMDFVISREFTDEDGQIVYRPYTENGRLQKQEDAIKLDKKIADKIYKFNPGSITLFGDEDKNVKTILGHLMTRHKL